jgi:hypothetical protein
MLRYRVAFLAVLAAYSTPTAQPLAAQSRPPVPGQPYQYWDVLEADGAARKIYFRNDLEMPVTITEVTISRCENTRQVCGTYPAKLVVDPGKTVMAFRVERFDKKLGWSYSYAFRTSGANRPSTPPPSEPPRAMTPTGPITVQTLPVDSLVPLVAATEENGSCGKITVPNLPEGHRAFVMVFGPTKQPTARIAMVRVDDNNAPYDYRDTRTEIGDNLADPYRSIVTIDFVRQSVMVQNTGHGELPTVFRATGLAIKTAASLGNPAALVARMVKECGK